jgi:hypothetical protein
MSGWKTYAGAAMLALAGIIYLVNGDAAHGAQNLGAALAFVGLRHFGSVALAAWLTQCANTLGGVPCSADSASSPSASSSSSSQRVLP